MFTIVVYSVVAVIVVAVLLYGLLLLAARIPDDLDAVWSQYPARKPRLETYLVLLGCVLAVAATVAMDQQFKPAPTLSGEWVCDTDSECEYEERAKARGLTCLRTSDDLMTCLPLDTR